MNLHITNGSRVCVVGVEQFPEARNLHAGIGIGLRIKTGFAPERLDGDRVGLQFVAAPRERFRHKEAQQPTHDWRSLERGIGLDRIKFRINFPPEHIARLNGVVVHP